MRIGIDYTSAARQSAGIGRYTRELVNALLTVDSRHRFTLFAASGGLRSFEFDVQPSVNVRLRKVPVTDDWLARLWHRLRVPIPVELITGPIDVFYSPDFVLPPTLPGSRTVVTVHDLSFLHYPSHFLPKLVRYLCRAVPRSVETADLVLADSQATKRDMINQLGTPPHKVKVIYSGVDKRFSPEGVSGEQELLRAKYDIGDGDYWLSVGTIQPRKNYLTLIEAFRRLAPEARLVIAGAPGWLYDDVVQQAGGCGDGVRILGYVDDADLPALYRNAELFVFPSLYEGFGLPVLEAMASGVPVVCSDSSSLPEVVGDAALLVDPRDPSAMAAAIAEVTHTPSLRHALVRRGLSRASQFTWEQAGQELLQAFEELHTPEGFKNVSDKSPNRTSDTLESQASTVADLGSSKSDNRTGE